MSVLGNVFLCGLLKCALNCIKLNLNLNCETVFNGDKGKFFFKCSHIYQEKVSSIHVKGAMTVFPCKTSQEKLVLLIQF